MTLRHVQRGGKRRDRESTESSIEICPAIGAVVTTQRRSMLAVRTRFRRWSGWRHIPLFTSMPTLVYLGHHEIDRCEYEAHRIKSDRDNPIAFSVSFGGFHLSSHSLSPINGWALIIHLLRCRYSQWIFYTTTYLNRRTIQEVYSMSTQILLSSTCPFYKPTSNANCCRHDDRDTAE